MLLLERDGHFQTLAAVLAEAQEGGGRVALLSGEAGIGKTTLVEHFVRAHQSVARVLFGACDALFTPRPLGPLYDIAQQLQGRLLTLIGQQAEPLAIFTAFLQVLQESSTPTIMVVEDIHWADEGTLDFLKFLGRRIQRTHCLLIVTYRDDELSPDHPLWRLLGDLPARYTLRLQLAPFSEAAVRELARQAGREATDLFTVTGGNPFFVTEVLADERVVIPRSVREAVVVRATRLPAAARELLDLASVVPTRAERWLLDAILQPSTATLEACTTSGLVRLEPDALVFRHDLARRAVQAALPAPRARDWHAAVLQALLSANESRLARIVHHARAARDESVLLTYAPRAAAQASALGAHREAAAHYEAALESTASLTAMERADLLEKRAYEYYLTGQIDRAIADREEVLNIWHQQQRGDKVGENLRWLSRLAWFKGQRKVAEQYADRAIAALESLAPGPQLAMAYSNRAQLFMLSQEVSEAVRWGTRALDLAGELGETETVVHALNNVGTALLQIDDETGRTQLLKSLQGALAHDLQEHAARAYTNLGSSAAATRDYARALSFLNQGIAYSEDRDLDAWSLYMRGWRARVYLEQGRWPEATADAEAVLRVRQGVVILRLPALTALAAVSVRRGDPAAGAQLDEALALALETAELQRIAPVAAARAEAAWWQGRADQVAAEVKDAFELACRQGAPWEVGELSLWLSRVGALGKIPADLAEPYRLQLNGEWAQAAAYWAQLGCPYEQAMALVDGDMAAQREALAIFEGLGAGPAAEALRQQLRAAGVTGLPRGPRPETAENPAGLTPRQWEVLRLLVDGMSDRDIGALLFISPKTVGHHVSAILSRLEVATRQEAAIVAVQQGWYSS